MSAELWASLDEVIERVIAGVVRRARLPAGDRDDFRQDARLFCLRRPPRIRTAFEGRSALETYLYTAVWRFCLTWQRRRRTLTVCLDGVTITAHVLAQPHGCGPGGSPEDDGCAEDLARRLRIALGRLPAADAWLLRRHFVDGHSIPAIARDLDVAVHALYTRLATILGRLGSALRARDVDERLVRHVLACDGLLPAHLTLDDALPPASPAEARRYWCARQQRREEKRREEKRRDDWNATPLRPGQHAQAWP